MRKQKTIKKMKKDPLALAFVSDAYKNDRDIVLKAVKSNGLALQFASKHLKQDKKIIFAAVMENTAALVYADAALKKDKFFVLSLLKNNNSTLIKYIDDSLKTDKTVILTAIKKSMMKYPLFKYLNDQLKNDTEIMSAFLNIDISGTHSPLPEILTHKMLQVMDSGMVLKLTTTDYGMYKDIPVLVTNHGDKIIKQDSIDNKCIFYIEKQ